MATTLTRRELLARSSVLLLMIPVAGAVGCGSDDSNGAAPTGGTDSGTSGNGCSGVFETSTVTDNHTHTLCVPETDLTAPPSAGVTYTTSISDDHSHTVVLTQAQLQTIASGGSVTVTTSAPAAHNFTIQKA